MITNNILLRFNWNKVWYAHVALRNPQLLLKYILNDDPPPPLINSADFFYNLFCSEDYKHQFYSSQLKTIQMANLQYKKYCSDGLLLYSGKKII